MKLKRRNDYFILYNNNIFSKNPKNNCYFRLPGSCLIPYRKFPFPFEKILCGTVLIEQ